MCQWIALREIVLQHVRNKEFRSVTATGSAVHNTTDFLGIKAKLYRQREDFCQCSCVNIEQKLINQLGQLTNNEDLVRLSEVMYRSCGQMIDPFGSHGEQLQQTNYTQLGTEYDVMDLRGGYSESWTVFWITAHFLHAAATFEEMGVEF